MSELKIVAVVKCCEQCPHYGYYSGGSYNCTETDERVVDGKVIAAFCPLVDFPSKRLAAMESTIRTLREPNKYSLPLATLSHVATKIGVTLDDRGSITLPLKDGNGILLSIVYITNIDVSNGSVIFFCASNSKKYKLNPDTNPPMLSEEIEGGEHDGMWKDVPLEI